MTTSAYAALPSHHPRTATHSWLDLARHISAIQRQRRRLGALDDETLDDIGLTRHQAHAEASRPLWDVPAFWRQ